MEHLERNTISKFGAAVKLFQLWSSRFGGRRSPHTQSLYISNFPVLNPLWPLQSDLQG